MRWSFQSCRSKKLKVAFVLLGILLFASANLIGSTMILNYGISEHASTSE